jgi:hypothetical protein
LERQEGPRVETLDWKQALFFKAAVRLEREWNGEITVNAAPALA